SGLAGIRQRPVGAYDAQIGARTWRSLGRRMLMIGVVQRPPGDVGALGQSVTGYEAHSAQFVPDLVVQRLGTRRAAHEESLHLREQRPVRAGPLEFEERPAEGQPAAADGHAALAQQ